MKLSFITFALLVFIALPAMAQVEAAEPASDQAPAGAMIEFEKETHNFGTLEKGADATYAFKFTNTGTEDLQIKYAKGSCGCTVPKWPKESIAPGETGEINVRYDSNRLGGINKSVTIQSNASNTPVKVIRITGKIIMPPTPTEEVAPVQEAPEGK